MFSLTWQGVAGGVKAAQAGHDVIMTPTSHCYIDYRQSLKCAPATLDQFKTPIRSFRPLPSLSRACRRSLRTACPQKPALLGGFRLLAVQGMHGSSEPAVL